jgi:ubiquinone/menaquinone biosynthesis C-methylase UbiE
MFADPESNIKQFGLESGMHIADLGAGSGAYTFPAARAVSPNGKIYACEVQKELITRMRNDASQQHITNVEFLWSNIEKGGGTKLGERSMDGAIVSNVLFIVEDRDGFLKEVKRILKPNGKVYFIDWSDSFGGMGPHPDQVITEAKAKELFSQHGFTGDKTFNAGAHHYGVIFKKS